MFVAPTVILAGEDVGWRSQRFADCRGPSRRDCRLLEAMFPLASDVVSGDGAEVQLVKRAYGAAIGPVRTRRPVPHLRQACHFAPWQVSGLREDIGQPRLCRPLTIASRQAQKKSPRITSRGAALDEPSDRVSRVT
jgi:hypothetical protein